LSIDGSQYLLQVEYGDELTTVNCFPHFAQVSKLPTGGLATLVHMDLESIVYVSSSSAARFAAAFAFALALTSAVFDSFCFFLGAFSGSSSSSES
jgi:hypothetical protein